ncbi:MAG: PDZ domain-containing protein [Burkholderiaceae bacterium]
MPAQKTNASTRGTARATKRRGANTKHQVTPAVAAGAAVVYDITPVDLAGHLFEVRMLIHQPDPAGQRVWLPAWIPGSYLIRDFARNIVQIRAHSGRREITLEKNDKHSWVAAPVAGSLTISYRVYAWDLSVRGAHLDQSHGFFNGTSMFLCAAGFESSACQLNIRPPKGAAFRSWRVATTMPRDGAKLWGFGRYQAADYDELIDHPVEMGNFTTDGFTAGGARHEIVISGKHDTDFKRLIADLKPICEAQIKLFDPVGKRAPVARYLFLTTAVGDGYGGLEHRASTALICARKDLPFKSMKGTPGGYQTFLGLASHEYFHTWNVKRIKPAKFVPYELASESYTRLLWVFEGFTSYYDDLMLVRSRAIGVDDYLKLVARNISNIQRGPGRHLQSVAESSFDAWTRFYKQDENAANAIVSYYGKGAMVALALDLSIRARSGHRRSLDDVMRLLWLRFGKNFDAEKNGIGESDIPALVRDATGLNLSRQIEQWAYGTTDIPLTRLLKPFGISIQKSPSEKEPVWIGARTVERNNHLVLSAVYSDGPAHRAGLSAGDNVIAIDGVRVATTAELSERLHRLSPDQKIEVSAFRADLLFQVQLQLESPPASAVELQLEKPRKKPVVQWLHLGKSD